MLKRFETIEGGKAGEPKKGKTPPRNWSCVICLHHEGVRTNMAIEVLRPTISGNRVNKGTKRLICLNCYMHNRYTVVQ